MLNGFQFDVIVVCIVIAVVALVFTVNFVRKTIRRARKNALIRANRRAINAETLKKQNQTNRMWDMIEQY